VDKELLENHERYRERKAFYAALGYDIDTERAFILKEAGPLEGAILEAGTGKGHFALELARAGYRFTTFDISETEQEFAKKNLKYFGLDDRVDWRIEDGARLSFSDKSFDVIFSVNTLHHLERPHAVVDELLRVLSDKGKIVLGDFTPQGFSLMEQIHASEGGAHSAGATTLADIETYLKKKGFQAQRTRSTFQEVLVARRDAI